MKCVYGKMYKMDCNTCTCGYDNSLICTKEVCLQPMDSEIIFDQVTTLAPTEATTVTGNKSKKRKIVRRNRKEMLQAGKYPPLPVKTGCQPGRFYIDNCKRCFCRSNRTPICSQINVCKEPKFTRATKPEDVRPPIKDKEFKVLPELPHSAAPCEPGTTYKIDCNVCICDEFMDLMCDKVLCISFSDMHKTEAVKRSGMPCNVNNVEENEVLQTKCVKCVCNGTTFCEAVDGCISDSVLTLRSYGARRNGSSDRITFDYMKQKCTPGHIYKDNCNKCYCQKDMTLRCTQKICLNYSQARSLEKQPENVQDLGL